MQLEQIKTKLFSQYGLDKGRCRCPAHGGKDKNLSVNFTKDGKFLAYCHSHQCSFKDILTSLGVERQPYKEHKNKNDSDVVSVDSYPYITTSGKEVWSLRNNYEDGSKEIKTYPVGIKEKTLPYRHNTIIDKEQQIIIVEGEKAAERLNSLGYTATTNKGGSGNVLNTDWKLLKEFRDIIIWADDDEPGEKWEESLRRILIDLDCELSRVEVYHTGTAMDAADYSTEEIETKISQAIPIPSPYRMYTAKELMALDDGNFSWMVEECIIDSGFFLIAAKPKSGKSTISRQLAISVANGVEFLGKKCQKRKTCYMGFEDGITWTNRHVNDFIFNSLLNKDPFLKDENIYFYVDMPPVNDYNERIKWLYTFIKKNELEFVMIDSLFFFLEGIEDSNSYDDMLKVLMKLKGVAKSSSCTIGITHHNKKADGDYNLDNCLGSTGITGTAEAIFLLKRMTEESSFIESRQRGGDGIEGRVKVDKERWWFELDLEFGKDKESQLEQRIEDFFAKKEVLKQGRDFYSLGGVSENAKQQAKEHGLNPMLLFNMNEINNHVEGRKAEVIKAIKRCAANDKSLIKKCGDTYYYGIAQFQGDSYEDEENWTPL